MAEYGGGTSSSSGTREIGRLSKDAQESLLGYARVVLDIHNRQNELRDKMEFIDVAYARYKALAAQADENNGVDLAASVPCGVDADDIIVPIVVSQVDSYHSYLSDIYLSGYPIFPVVSTPATIKEAEKLQAIIDDHATRGRYQRQLAKSLLDSVKYNLSAIEVDWCALDLYNVVNNISQPAAKKKIEASSYYINKLLSLDCYNLIYDHRVDPVDVPMHGEYAGYIEIISRVELKRRLMYAASTEFGYYTSQAMATKLGSPNSGPNAIYGYFKEKPQISNIITNKNSKNAQIADWEQYLTNKQKSTGTRVAEMSDVYEYVTLYARIIPEEHSISAPKRGSPQVWKLCFVNHERLVYAERIFTIYDTIPIYFSQPKEDGFALQSKSPAENAIPFQEADSKLFSIRLNAARRAIVDRALYDQTAFNSNDINSPFPAAKIPFKANSLLGTKSIDQIYKSIPFDSRGTETVVQDMQMLSQMADDMNGINKPQRGQFQKGNKSRKEWEDTMAGSYGRMRNCALMIEYQQMLPIKEQIKMNIFYKGTPGQYQNQTSGEMYEITADQIEAFRKTINNFKIADGLLPADKIASTEMLAQGVQMLASSQQLQMAFGPEMLAKMYLYLMNVGGVQNMDQFMPSAAQIAQAQAMQQAQASQGVPQQAAQGSANGTPTA